MKARASASIERRPFHSISFSTKTTSHCLSKARQAPVARVLHLTRREKTNNFNFKVSWKTIKENDNQETASNASMDENRGKSESTNERTNEATNECRSLDWPFECLLIIERSSLNIHFTPRHISSHSSIFFCLLSRPRRKRRKKQDKMEDRQSQLARLSIDYPRCPRLADQARLDSELRTAAANGRIECNSVCSLQIDFHFSTRIH